MKFLVQWLIDWPERVAHHLTWLAPLFARITVGWVFLWSGWGKLQSLPQVTENFVGWGIPFPHVLAPFVSGVEFFGGLFLLLGFLTRISAGALSITMIVAIVSAKWADVDSLETLLGFDEFEYLALFLWLAIAGPGPVSIDRVLQRRYGR
jgi:putative oxidoreductase